MSAVVFLAYDPNAVKPGWIAFFVVMALIVATFFLWRNMNSQLRRIKVPSRASFQEAERSGKPLPEPGDQAETDAGPDPDPSGPPVPN